MKNVSGCLASSPYDFRVRRPWVQTTHKKALEGAGDFEKGYSEKLKTEFRRLAIPVSRWLRVNLVLMTFNIWAFAWQWAVQYWPNQLQHITWPWLRPWL